MDWLMGKARGVSRGLMNNNTPVSAPVSPECVPPAESPVDSGYAGSREVRPRPSTLYVEAPLANGIVGPPSSSPALSHSPDNSPSTKRRNSCKSSKSSPDASDPLFMQPKYISQQLTFAGSTEFLRFEQLIEPFPSMDQNEWLAAHTIALFDNISTIFDAIQELCSCSQLLPCQAESAPLPSQTEGTFCDEEKCKKQKNASPTTSNPNQNPARHELDTALSSCNDLIQSSKIFPVRHGAPFPPDLPNYVTLICKNLLICIIHIYSFHFHHLEQLELIAHMNTLAKHFFVFTTRFSLIDEKLFDPLMGFHKLLLSF